MEMFEIFDFMQDFDNHAERKVDTYKEDDLFVDTCAVSDSTQPYETAIAHPDYNEGKMVIVELYDTKEEAQAGHDKWVGAMTAKKLPRTLQDVSTSNIIKFAQEVGIDMGGEIMEKAENSG